MTGRSWVLLVFVLGGIGLSILAFWRAEGTPPQVGAPASLAVGREAREIPVAISDEGSGLRAFRATLRHAGGETPLFSEEYPGNFWAGGVSAPAREVVVAIDPAGLELGEGDAFLVLSTRDWSWRGGLGGNETLVEIPVAIDLSPPGVSVASGLTYVRRGGSGAVAYTISEPVVRDGVQVGEVFFQGFPASPGDPAQRVALFAFPTDAPRDPPVHVIAEDAAGNLGRGSWAVVVQEVSLPVANVTLPSSFLENQSRALAESKGIDVADLVEAFDRVNTEMRAANEKQIREATAGGIPEPLFSGGFEQLENSKVTSRFAERRTYFVGGQPVSKATHFGYDLASTAAAPITAANAGRVVYADDLGIYGTTVLIDHGIGLTSLYGHLSSLDVAAGDRVEKGGVLGRSGATGLAGGDHLHFAILVGETYVDPLEWWDAEWVRTHVDRQLALSGR